MSDTPDQSDAGGSVPGDATSSDPGNTTPTGPGGTTSRDPDAKDAGPADPVEAERRDAPDREDEGEGAFGEAAPETAVEPGAPSIENTAFVLLGVASTIGLMLHLASLTG